MASLRSTRACLWLVLPLGAYITYQAGLCGAWQHAVAAKLKIARYICWDVTCSHICSDEICSDGHKLLLAVALRSSTGSGHHFLVETDSPWL
jgi:hypothetical protein